MLQIKTYIHIAQDYCLARGNECGTFKGGGGTSMYNECTKWRFLKDTYTYINMFTKMTRFNIPSSLLAHSKKPGNISCDCDYLHQILRMVIAEKQSELIILLLISQTILQWVCIAFTGLEQGF